MTDILARAFEAKNELPSVKRAVALLKQKAFDDWEQQEDPAERERLWQRVSALNDIVQMITVAASEVEMAEHRANLQNQGFES